jgi:hypothetical protein
VTAKPWRITPIQNFRQAWHTARRDRDYNRRNTKIAIGANAIIGVLLLATLGGHAALVGLMVANGTVLGLCAIATFWLNIRNEPATGLAAIRGTTNATIDEIKLAMRETFDCEPQQTERDDVVLLACETSRSNMSYGEWIVLWLHGAEDGSTRVEALSWNSSPTATFGVNRRNLNHLAATLGLRDIRELTHKGARNVVSRWLAAGILTGKPTPRPSWHSGTHVA